MGVLAQQLIEFLVATFVFGVLLNVALQILLAIAFEPGIRVHLFVSAIIFGIVIVVTAIIVWLVPAVRTMTSLPGISQGTVTVTTPSAIAETPKTPLMPGATLTSQPAGVTPTMTTLIMATATPSSTPAATQTATVTATLANTATPAATPTPARGPLSSRGALLLQGNLYAADGDRGWAPLEVSSSRPYVKTVAIDSRGEGAAHVGTTKGVFVTGDGGATWLSQSDGLPAGAINALVWRTTGGNRELLAGTELGVYRLSGDRWELLTSDLRDQWIGALITDPSGQTVYAATYNYLTGEGRVYRLTSNQTTWESVTPPIQEFLVGALIHNNQSESLRLYAGALNGRVYLIDPASKTQLATTRVEGRKITTLALAPRGLLVGTDSGLFTTPRALTETPKPINEVPAVAIGGLWSTDGKTWYVMTERGAYRSQDFGSSWDAALVAPSLRSP